MLNFSEAFGFQYTEFQPTTSYGMAKGETSLQIFPNIEEEAGSNIQRKTL